MSFKTFLLPKQSCTEFAWGALSLNLIALWIEDCLGCKIFLNGVISSKLLTITLGETWMAVDELYGGILVMYPALKQ